MLLKQSTPKRSSFTHPDLSCQEKIISIGNRIMASRPVFVPLGNGVGVVERLLNFTWYPGLSKAQKQRSISALHDAARVVGIDPVLEISSKSLDELGVDLSAFNLCIHTRKRQTTFTVETAFQGSKVFEHGGPFRDLLGMDSRSAKKDMRLRESGRLLAFEFFGKRFPLRPWTYFYDWIYINALNQNDELAQRVLDYRGFTDIEFNPERSVNCQAYSAALYVS